MKVASRQAIHTQAVESAFAGDEMNDAPKISVICWVDPQNPVIGATLTAYAQQRCQPEDFEVIVVTFDGSADYAETFRRILDANRAMGGHLRCLPTTLSGRAASNNFAAAHAKAPLLLFASADFVPCPGFVSAHVAFHDRHPQDECVGIGPVRSPEELRAASDFLAWAEDTGNIFAIDFKAEAPVAPKQYFYCGNSTIKAQFFARVRRFDPDFPYESLDDTEFTLRASNFGLRSYLVPGAGRNGALRSASGCYGRLNGRRSG